jgi:hypothetical protein
MEKGLEPGINPEEFKKILKRLLAERLCTAIQALIDTAGVDGGKKALDRYMFHSGMAGSEYFSPIVKGDSLERISMAYFLAESCLSNGQSVLEIRENGAICDTVGCILGDGPPELCIHFLQSSVDGFAKDIDDNYEIVSQSFLNRGSPCCQKVIRKKGTNFTTREELGPLRSRVEKSNLSKEEMFSISCQYLGEWWNNTTLGFINLFGSEKTLMILRPYMRHSGLVMGIALSKELKIPGRDASAIGSLIDYYGSFMQQTGKVSTSNAEMVEKEISSCPFSSSPFEICKQEEFIHQGIVEAINPEYEFACDRMMTKGDKMCHWTIRRKASIPVEKKESNSSNADPVDRLTSKFIDGEITEEEFDRKMATLRKHGIVK